MLIDTHAHLTMQELAQDLGGVLGRAAVAGVSRIVCVGIDLPSSQEAVEIAQRRPGVAAAVGVHPNDSTQLPPGWVNRLRALASLRGVVAIGEIGLDYYRMRAGRDQQQEVLKAQLELAGELGLPVVIHSREAEDELTGILLEWAAGLPSEHPRGVLHCFSGEASTLESCCGAGFYVSFAGPITFRNAGPAAEMAVAAPADRLLLETDSPYLAPHPYRGKRNEPAFLRLVAEKMAELRGESPASIAETTSRNATTLFGLETLPVLEERQ